MKKYHFGFYLFSLILNYVFYLRIFSESTVDSFGFSSSFIICILILIFMIIYNKYYAEQKYLSSDELFIKNVLNILWRTLLYLPTFTLVFLIGIYVVGLFFNKDIQFYIRIFIFKIIGFGNIF
ncbi:hypothetical protein [Leptospira harrisiae]|uniref:Uncharacterized protein n=1 Tax=Leptospira harrisiae TaxID=2023189 RepID=A0A2N0AMA4_9LEPT|nr:hypothetical protein [Leptospira harrisiae]PJZ85436.1 hypothetical protein CH364_04145 [Leptospira harrisiae]PKA08973.1 hypothetical protein CH366_04285 [Leptospira harrisiae]